MAAARKREAVVAAPDRLDRVLALLFPELSRRSARDAIDRGAVFVDGARCRVASRRVAAGARVRWFGETHDEGSPELPVLYRDDDLLVLDKPPGVVVNESETARAPTVVDRHRWVAPFVVHRLDRDTSGVLVLARHREAAREVSEAFRARRVRKVYDAIVTGLPPDGWETAAVGADPRRPRARRVRADGRPASTWFRSLATERGLTRVEARPITGRTHQIRVHLRHRGAPIFGDLAYEGVDRVRVDDEVRHARRPALHARALELPRGETVHRFEAPVPADLRALMRASWDDPVDWELELPARG